jgi:hypothetical protein
MEKGEKLASVRKIITEHILEVPRMVQQSTTYNGALSAFLF